MRTLLLCVLAVTSVFAQSSNNDDTLRNVINSVMAQLAGMFQQAQGKSPGMKPNAGVQGFGRGSSGAARSGQGDGPSNDGWANYGEPEPEPEPMQDAMAELASAARYTYEKEPVQFSSHGVRLSGLLFKPKGLKAPAPAVTVMGPVLYVKEQAPLQYATRLASRGFVVLIFDARNHGESDGEPRRQESGKMKIEDIAASVDFLQTRQEVDPEKIAMLGVCMGATWAVQAAAADPRLKTLATVAGFYVNREDWEHMFGSPEAFDQRVQDGDAAMAKFESTGQVDYLPIIDENRTDVLLPQKGIWAWYMGWEPHSTWENRYAVLSNVDLLSTDIEPAARRLRKPWLLVHSDRSNNPENARAMHDLSPSPMKEVQWQGDAIHTWFYDQPDIIDTAVAGIYDFYKKTLM